MQIGLKSKLNFENSLWIIYKEKRNCQVFQERSFYLLVDYQEPFNCDLSTLSPREMNHDLLNI